MRVVARPLRLAVLVSLCVGVVSCADAGNGAPDGSRAVTFRASDGVELSGRVFGDGTRAVVLAHMRPGDQSTWYAFAERLARAGYLAFTFNFRGTCPGGDGGCSRGETVTADLWRDVVGAIDHVRSEHGADAVALVGASSGGTASLVAAAQPGANVRVVVTLSAPAEVDGLSIRADVLSQVTAAKVFVAGVGDATAAASAQRLYEIAPPPKRVEILPADDHGTELLEGGRGEEVRRLIEAALETNRV